MRRSETGNILFLILLAVVLFAALSYAVTSSMRGGGKDAGSENMQAAVASMLQHFSQLDAAVTRMQLTGGIKAENISFGSLTKQYGGNVGTNNVNSNCTSSDCKIFDVNGGNVTDRSFEKYGTAVPTGIAANNMMPGYWQIYMLQWPNAGTSLNDLVIQYVYMSPAFCDKMMAVIGQSNPASIGGNFVNGATPNNWDNTAYTVTSNASQVSYKDSFVMTYIGSGAGLSCHVNHLLIAR